MILSTQLPPANREQIFNYQLPGHPRNSSKCYLMLYQSRLGKQIIILSELKDNPGSSITNTAEYIPEQLKDFLLQNYNIKLTEDAIFIEHYEANYYGDGEEERFALFDRNGKFQHLSIDNLNLIFESGECVDADNISNGQKNENDSKNLDVIALLRSWSEEDDDEYDEDELDITYQLRGSPFVTPILDTWTIYKDLKDFPGKYVAVKRIGGYTYADRKSELIIEENIDKIRDVMEKEGRIRREPVHNDEDTIVEFWI